MYIGAASTLLKILAVTADSFSLQTRKWVSPKFAHGPQSASPSSQFDELAPSHRFQLPILSDRNAPIPGPFPPPRLCKWKLNKSDVVQIHETTSTRLRYAVSLHCTCGAGLPPSGWHAPFCIRMRARFFLYTCSPEAGERGDRASVVHAHPSPARKLPNCEVPQPQLVL